MCGSGISKSILFDSMLSLVDLKCDSSLLMGFSSGTS
jgi:hypothetical protein